MIALIVLVCIGCGFLIGKLHERFLWNQLIHDGLLQEPEASAGGRR